MNKLFFLPAKFQMSCLIKRLKYMENSSFGAQIPS